MANYFWVGGSGNWDGTTNHFATSSGGTATVAAPGAADTVTFDGNSGSATITLTTSPSITSLNSSSALNTFTMGSNTLTYSINWFWTAGTLNAGSSTITQTGSGTFFGAGLTYNVVNFQANTNVNGSNTFTTVTCTGGIHVSFNAANTFGTLSYANTTDTSQALMTVQANQTVNTALTLTGGNQFSQRLFVSTYPDLFNIGNQFTITCNGTINLTNVDFLDIAGAGTASWSGTSIGNCGGNSGIAFTAPTTRYWVGNTGNFFSQTGWASASGGAAGATMPLPQDTAIFDANSFNGAGQSCDIQPDQRIGTLNFSAVTNNPTFGHGTFYIYIFGSMTFASNMTQSSHINFAGRGSNTITSNGFVGGSNQVQFVAANGSYTIADNFSNNASFNYLSANLTAINANVTTPGVFFNDSAIRTLNMGSGTWTLTSGGPWAGSSMGNVTINTQTSTISLTNNSTSNLTFGFAGNNGPAAYNNVKVLTGGSTSVTFFQQATYTNMTIAGSGTKTVFFQTDNTFGNLTINTPNTVMFTNGTTQTVKNFTANGVSGTPVYLRSSVDNYPFRLNVSTGYSVSFVDVRASDASGSLVA